MVAFEVVGITVGLGVVVFAVVGTVVAFVLVGITVGLGVVVFAVVGRVVPFVVVGVVVSIGVGVVSRVVAFEDGGVVVVGVVGGVVALQSTRSAMLQTRRTGSKYISGGHLIKTGAEL